MASQHLSRGVVVLGLVAALASAQSTLVVPAGYANTVGNSNNAFPWSRGTASMRIQQVYDSSHFTTQSIVSPIVITGMKFRPYAGATASWTGGTWPNVRIDMATCPLDYLAVSTTFANNLGTDLTTVHNGAVTVQPGSTLGAGVVVPWYIDIPLATPFLYDPVTGNDLVFDVHLDGTGWSGGSRGADVVTGAAANARASRIYSTSGLSATTGTITTEHGMVCEFTYQPAQGLFASFTASATRGPSPLTVNFTDQSFTSAPGGVQSWLWDFDGDNVPDSALQNPTHTYTQCGSYTVTLTVNDGVNAPSVRTRANYIVTDTVTPSFTTQQIGPGLVQFTDTSTPTPTSWAWDLNGDNVVDSTLANPVWNYGANCVTAAVTLTVNRNCQGPFALTRTVNAGNSLETRRDGTTSTTTGSGGYFDLAVTVPGGINLCRMETKTTVAANAAMTINVFVTPDSYVGRNNQVALWRQVASVATIGAPTGNDLESVTFNPPIYLPTGNYGMHVQIVGGSAQYSTQTATTVFGNADLTLTTGAVGVLGNTVINNRTWNGALYYTTAAGLEAGFGFFGAGCPNSLGLTNLTATSRPQVGQTLNVTLDDLPLSAALLLVGLSNTSSPLGPLPTDLAPFGAPNCFVRVSPDASTFLFGAGNAATWSFAVPNTPTALGVLLFAQALVLDPTLNGLGGATSDAAGILLGS